MKWNVKSISGCYQIELSEYAGQHAQTAIIGERKINYIWNQSSKSFLIEDGLNAEHIDIRSIRHESFPGESESKVFIDYWDPAAACVRSFTATVEVSAPGQEHRKAKGAKSGEKIRAPMTGKILRLDVKVGDVVQAGQCLAVIEAMKMENTIAASRAGKVSKISVDAGQSVATGAELIRLSEIDS
jgi:biotin carboxyl carrier protein